MINPNAQGEEITSKKFKDQCSLQFAYLVETFYKTIGDKKKSYTLRTPLSAWEIAQSDSEEGSDGSGSGSDSGSSDNPTPRPLQAAATAAKAKRPNLSNLKRLASPVVLPVFY